MKQYPTLLPAIGLLLAAFFSSCTDSNNNDCVSYQFVPVTNVAGPSTGLANQDILLDVKFAIGNGCGAFNNFETSMDGDTTLIKVNAKFTGCMCTAIFMEPVVAYTFHPTIAGIYYFKYYNSDQQYIRDTLLIQ